MDEAGQGIVLSSPPKCGVPVARVGLSGGRLLAYADSRRGYAYDDKCSGVFTLSEFTMTAGWATITCIIENFCTCEFAFIARNRAAGEKNQNGDLLRCFLVNASVTANVNRDQVPAIGGIQWSIGLLKNGLAENTDPANPQMWGMGIDPGHADDKVGCGLDLLVEDLREFDDFSIKTDDPTHNGAKFQLDVIWHELQATVVGQTNIGREGGLFTIHRPDPPA